MSHTRHSKRKRKDLEAAEEDVPAVTSSSNESSNDSSFGKTTSNDPSSENVHEDTKQQQEEGRIAEYDEYSDEYLWTCTPPFCDAKNGLLQHLRGLDESMRCPICRLILDIPVMIPSCKHSFCSECIRKALKAGLRGMKRKSECPVCRQPTEERDLLPNYSLGDAAKQWKHTRPHLYTTLATFYTTATTTQHPPPTTTKKQPENSTTETEDDDYDDDDDDDFSPSKKQKHRTAKKAKATSVVHSSTERLRPKPTPHYHGMKKKALQNLLSKDGLPTTGTEAELKERHQEYLLLYNAECDAQHPRSNQQLIQVLLQRESKRKEEIMQSFQNGTRNHTYHLENLKKTCSSSSDQKVSSGNAAFDQTLSNNFKELIQKAKERGIVKNSPQNNPTPFDISKYDAPPIITTTTSTNSTPMRNPISPSHVATTTSPPNPKQTNFVNSNHNTSSQSSRTIHNPYTKSPFSENKSTTKPKTYPLSSIHSPPNSYHHPAVTQNFQPIDLTSSCSIPNPYKSTNNPFGTAATTTNQGRPPPYKSQRSEWECAVCTFINKNRRYANATCEMCGTRRPASTKI